MKGLFRETAFGRVAYLVSGGKLFAYEEELDPSLLKRYAISVTSTPTSSRMFEVDNHVPEKRTVDAELGKDYLLVDWNENDPHNPKNWSTSKKLFVTFQICLLTTSVYIGSAIYTAGIEGITKQFEVSEVRALLGLTLFVLGYALGPMIWV